MVDRQYPLPEYQPIDKKQRTHKAEDAELHVCHSFGADVDLNAKSHKPNLLKHAGEQGIQQMCALVNKIISDNRRKNTDVVAIPVLT